ISTLEVKIADQATCVCADFLLYKRDSAASRLGTAAEGNTSSCSICLLMLKFWLACWVFDLMTSARCPLAGAHSRIGRARATARVIRSRSNSLLMVYSGVKSRSVAYTP